MTTLAHPPLTDDALEGPLRATSDQTSLTAALRSVTGAVSSRPPLPVLAGVLVEGRGDHLRLSMFDFDTAGSHVVPGEGTGRALVPGAVLLDLVKDLDKGCRTELATDHGAVTLTGDGVTYTLPALPLEDYPALPALPEQPLLTLTGADVAQLADVLTAVGRDDSVPGLTCLQLRAGGGTLQVTGTDRYRLALLELPAEGTGDAEFLLPKAAADHAVRAFGRADRVQLRHTDGWVSFTDGVRTLTSRVSDAVFPRVAGVATDTFAGTVEVDPDALVKAVRQVAKAADRGVPVRAELGDGTVTWTAGGDGEVQAHAVVPAEVDGVTGAMGFNPAFLLDGVRAARGEPSRKAAGARDATTGRLQLQIVTLTKPCRLGGPHRPGFSYWLMPVRLPDAGR